MSRRRRLPAPEVLREAGLVDREVGGHVPPVPRPPGCAARARTPRSSATRPSGRRPTTCPSALAEPRTRASRRSPHASIVDVDQATVFAAFTDPGLLPLARRAGDHRRRPLRVHDGVRSTRTAGHLRRRRRADLVALRWDFEDDNVPVPGGEMTGYLRFHTIDGRMPVSTCTNSSTATRTPSSWRWRGRWSLGRCEAGGRGVAAGCDRSEPRAAARSARRSAVTDEFAATGSVRTRIHRTS